MTPAPQTRARRRLKSAPAAGRRGAVRGWASRRGLTMLEVVFAVLLLGMVVTSATSLISLATRLHTDNMQRLGAYEVANRIILMHLDERVKAPRESEVISQGRHRYRFRLEVEPVKMTVKQTESSLRSAEQIPMGRFKQVTVRVWIVAEGDDNAYAAPGEEMAQLTRIYDPVADMFRNPDARERLVNNPDAMLEYIRTFTGFSGSQPQPAGGAGGGTGSGAGSGGGR